MIGRDLVEYLSDGKYVHLSDHDNQKMALVFCQEDKRVYYLKKYNNESKPLLENLKAIDDTRIPKIKDIYEISDLYCTERYIYGETLQQYVDSKSKISIEDFIFLSWQAVQIVMKLHEKNIAHGEITATNIIVNQDVQLHLSIIDFDKATFLDTLLNDDNISQESLTILSQLTSSVPSKEQPKDSQDIIALGIMLLKIYEKVDLKEEDITIMLNRMTTSYAPERASLQEVDELLAKNLKLSKLSLNPFLRRFAKLFVLSLNAVVVTQWVRKEDFSSLGGEIFTFAVALIILQWFVLQMFKNSQFIQDIEMEPLIMERVSKFVVASIWWVIGIAFATLVYKFIMNILLATINVI